MTRPCDSSKAKKMEGLGMHHSTTEDQRVRGHSLVESLYVVMGRRCTLAPHLYRQQSVCEVEGVPFASKIELMETTIRTCEPIAGTVTHVLLDSWYSAKRLWRAARERKFLITTGIKSNRWLAVADPSAPKGWKWQRLSEYTAQLSASDYIEVPWPKGEKTVYVHTVTTQVRSLYRCQIVIVRQSLDAPVSQARSWASSDVEASPQTLLSHIATRWDIEVLFGDSKEELGLDQYQLMSAKAIVRL
jgi:SRSO17 transposase